MAGAGSAATIVLPGRARAGRLTGCPSGPVTCRQRASRPWSSGRSNVTCQRLAGARPRGGDGPRCRGRPAAARPRPPRTGARPCRAAGGRPHRGTRGSTTSRNGSPRSQRVAGLAVGGQAPLDPGGVEQDGRAGGGRRSTVQLAGQQRPGQHRPSASSRRHGRLDQPDVPGRVALAHRRREPDVEPEQVARDLGRGRVDGQHLGDGRPLRPGPGQDGGGRAGRRRRCSWCRPRRAKRGTKHTSSPSRTSRPAIGGNCPAPRRPGGPSSRQAAEPATARRLGSQAGQPDAVSAAAERPRDSLGSRRAAHYERAVFSERRC